MAEESGAGIAPSGRLAALSSPSYRRFWLGSLASVGATQLLIMALGWLVFELSASPLDLGLLGASVSLPTIVMTLFGGVLADRVDRRRLLIATSSFTAVLLVLLAALDLSGAVRVWHVLVIAAAWGGVSGLDFPARQSVFPSLIEPAHMMSAVALGSVLWQGSRMVMPALGGVIIAVSDTGIVFALCAGGFVAMAMVMGSLRIPHVATSGGATVSRMAEGFRFIATQPRFAAIIPLTFVLMFFGTSYVQIMPAFARLHGVEEQGYGLLISATGIGSVTGTVLVGAWQHSRRLGHLMLGSVTASVCSLYTFALVAHLAPHLPGAYAWALLFAMMTGMFSSMFLIASMTVLQLEVPGHLRGRVMGIHSIAFSLIALGGLVGGAIASKLGPPAATGIGASVVLLATAAIWIAHPSIRNIDGRRLTGAP